jgi:hypothetical protein
LVKEQTVKLEGKEKKKEEENRQKVNDLKMLRIKMVIVYIKRGG